MIVRIVKMTFKEGAVDQFKEIFHASKNKIREIKGCIFLELLQDLENPHVFMTYSVWHSKSDLERYRDSELFKTTWAASKVLFAAPPEAQSMERIEKA